MKAKMKLAALAFGAALTALIGAGTANAAPADQACDNAFGSGGWSLPGDFQSLSAGIVYCGNDNPDVFNSTTDGLNGSLSLAKYESDGGTWLDGKAPGDQSDAFQLSNLVSSGDTLSGDWTFTPQTGEFYPTILLIKAGPGFVIQLITAFATSGSFSTDLLGGKGLSHLSFYDGIGPCTESTDPNCGGGGGNPVPVPGALPLMMSGVAGFGYLTYRRRRAKNVT